MRSVDCINPVYYRHPTTLQEKQYEKKDRDLSVYRSGIGQHHRLLPAQQHVGHSKPDPNPQGKNDPYTCSGHHPHANQASLGWPHIYRLINHDHRTKNTSARMCFFVRPIFLRNIAHHHALLRGPVASIRANRCDGFVDIKINLPIMLVPAIGIHSQHRTILGKS